MSTRDQGADQADHTDTDAPFDFSEYRRVATEKYGRVRSDYEAFAEIVRDILRAALEEKDINVNSVEARAKELESFGKKAETESESNPNEPKYSDPMNDITDLAGVRVIAFFPRSLHEIGKCICRNFKVIEYKDFRNILEKEEKFGYHSEHYLVKLRGDRSSLSEYKSYADFIAEIQVRTVLQHAWAEIDHDIQYKSSRTTPDSIRRKFMSLAGLLEIADREFQAIQDESEKIKKQERDSFKEGTLEKMGVTANALKLYLDEKVGSDGRVSEFSYEWIAEIIHDLGFTSLDQVDGCIENYSADEVTRIRWGWRQGPVQRFEDMLLAGMGHLYVERRTSDPKWQDLLNRTLERYRENSIPVGNYDPQAEPKEESPE